jgi:formylglycine-generating enzyme required for sulfatase activity
MGSDDAYRRDALVHRVRLTRDFWIGATEVTQAQWRAVMGNNPSYFLGDEKPVEQVSWEDCAAFLDRLNAQERQWAFRLPSEAEWEYAARAGKVSGVLEDPLACAWNGENSLMQTHPVARKHPNAWGLFYMVGNVWEWSADTYAPYPPYPQTDPLETGDEARSARGGSWRAPFAHQPEPHKGAARVSLRYGWPADYRSPDLGFRVAAQARP